MKPIVIYKFSEMRAHDVAMQILKNYGTMNSTGTISTYISAYTSALKAIKTIENDESEVSLKKDGENNA